jgi:hypothetical protein
MKAAWIGVGMALLSGCVTLKGQVKDRAASDFNCAKERIGVQKVQGTGHAGTFKAWGCGRERLYIAFCGPTGCVVDAESEMRGDMAPPSPAPAAQQAEPEPREPVRPPTGAAGFEFGTSAETAESTCSGAGNSYSAAGDEATCSGAAANVGFETPVVLSYCSGKLCGVRFRETTGGKLKSVVKRYRAVMTLLEERYGKPASHKGEIPSRCDEVLSCVNEEQLVLRTQWKFPNQQTVMMRVIDDGGVVIELDYRAPGGGGDLAL